MPSDYWNGRNEAFVKNYQIRKNIRVDGLAGEETSTKLAPRLWPAASIGQTAQYDFFVTNPFNAGVHDGVDIFLPWDDEDQLIDGYWTSYAGGRVFYPFGTMAIAAAMGEVSRVEKISTGLLILLEHNNGDTTGYFHGVPETERVDKGDTVSPGMALFHCGHDLRWPLGNTNPVHVHFTVKRDGVYMDPEAWLLYAKRLAPGVFER